MAVGAENLVKEWPREESSQFEILGDHFGRAGRGIVLQIPIYCCSASQGRGR